MASVASTDESEPPQPVPQNLPAASLNPLWQAAAAGGYSGKGRGRGGGGRGRGGSSGSDAGDGEPAAMGPISLAELEQRHRQTADGAESSLFTDDEEESGRREDGAPGKKRRRDGDSAEKEAEQRAESAEASMAAAAFGAGGFTVESADNDSEAESSSVGGALMPYKRTFPVRGVTCIGCSAERAIVNRVDDFIKTNGPKMQEDALFRTASVFWRTTVVEPARREGVCIPCWEWKDLRSHYQFHVSDVTIQRLDMVRQLANMRKMLELQMVKTEDGARAVDPKSFDMMLKVTDRESKELELLTRGLMPPPQPRNPAQARPGGDAGK